MAHNPNTIGKTYNLGTWACHAIRVIIADLLRGLGKVPDAYPIQWESSTPGDPPKTHASMESIANDIGWRPRVDAKEGIRRTVDGYRSREQAASKK